MAGEGQMKGFARKRATLWPSVAAIAVTASVSIIAELFLALPWFVSALTGFAVGNLFLLGALQVRRRKGERRPSHDDLHELREEMEVSQMRAVACLASQIAHDVRNPVAAISGSAQLLSRLSDRAQSGDSQCSKLLADEQNALCRAIIEESNRLDAVIARFQSFAELSETNLRTVLSVPDERIR